MAHPKIDWNMLEGDWRAGIKSVRQLARDWNQTYKDNKVSFVAISKHFKKLGIERSLAPAIYEKAEAEVNRKMVVAPLNNGSDKRKIISDSQIVDGNAAILSDLQLSHRAHVSHNKSIIVKLLSELDFQTDNQELYNRLSDLIEEDFKVEDGAVETRVQQERRSKLRTFFDKALSTGGRIDSVKKLTEALREVILLERKIYGIDAGGSGEDSLESGLAQVKEAERKRLDALPKEIGVIHAAN